MKLTNTIKTCVCADFLLAIIVNYGNNKIQVPYVRDVWSIWNL